MKRVALFVIFFILPVWTFSAERDVKQLKNASVKVITKRKEACPDCGKPHIEKRGSGSGTIIKSVFNWDGNCTNYVITARHVVNEGAILAWIEIFINEKSYGCYEAEILLKGSLRVGGEYDADVALLKFNSDRELDFASLAIAEEKVSVGDLVMNIGCPGGEIPPIVLNTDMKIVAIDRYLGARTIECNKPLTRGRSGGGLFNDKNELIGVCSAQRTDEKKGIYISWKEILKMLKGTDYEFLMSNK